VQQGVMWLSEMRCNTSAILCSWFFVNHSIDAALETPSSCITLSCVSACLGHCCCAHDAAQLQVRL
jgi:hypothetical protein